MRPSIAWRLLFLAPSILGYVFSPRSYDTHDFYAIHLDPSVSPESFAAHLGLEHEGQLGELEDHHMFSITKSHKDVVDDAVQDLRRRRRKRDHVWQRSPLDGIHLTQKQKLKAPMVKRGFLDDISIPTMGSSRVGGNRWGTNPASKEALKEQTEIAKELEISDPIFQDQWHLFNTLARDDLRDLNVTGLWQEGITGHNTTVCIVDDGLDFNSDDLKDNYFAAGSYDFNEKVPEPKPRLVDDRHGTRCAGEVSAVKNDVCGVGVAYNSRIAGIRILSKPIGDADEAAALNYKWQETDIYSCSWGPADDGVAMDKPGILIRKAMVNAVQKGRGGKGSIYVFAAGNGAAKDDNCNFDGYTNSIYSITVGSIDKEEQHPYYSEKCSAQLVVTYSSGAGDSIHTTDVGKDSCTVSHGGTSAAGPLGAGIFALALSVRPDLTWRDMQALTVETAVKLSTKSDWQETTIGKSYSHQFGYGKLDAYAFVQKAKDWELLKPQSWFYSPWMHVKHDLPQGNRGVASHFEVTEEMLKKANFEKLEHVTVTMNVQHTRRGDLSVELQSPSGVISHLSTARRPDNTASGYKDWTFMSVAHWGESGVGKWTVIVKDTKVNEHSGFFQDWKLGLFGESINGDNQPLLPLPAANDDDDHDIMTVTATTLPITVPHETATDLSNPTDHIHRPINAKPTGTFTTGFEPAITAPATTAGDDAQQASPSSTGAPSDSFLPSPFPTFGLSKHTQIWVYSAFALILAFCISLALYLHFAAKKRRRNTPRDDYEFAMLDDVDDIDGGALGAGGRRRRRRSRRSGENQRLADDDEEDSDLDSDGRGAKRGKRRAGELYNAFAGESDEELFSDDDEDEGRYRDHHDDDGEKEEGGASRSRSRSDEDEEVDEKTVMVASPRK